MNYLFVLNNGDTRYVYGTENVEGAFVELLTEDGIYSKEALSKFDSTSAKVAFINSFYKEKFQIKDIVEFVNHIYGLPEKIEYISREYAAKTRGETLWKS